MFREKQYEIECHTYYTWEDREDDNIKTFHEVVLPDGSEIDADFSPYNRGVDRETLRKWIELGYPSRGAVGSIGPLYPEHIENLYNQKQGEK